MELNFVGVLDEEYESKSEKSAGTRYMTFKALITVDGEEKTGKFQLVAKPGVKLPKMDAMNAKRYQVLIAPSLFRSKEHGNQMVLNVLSLNVSEI